MVFHYFFCKCLVMREWQKAGVWRSYKPNTAIDSSLTFCLFVCLPEFADHTDMYMVSVFLLFRGLFDCPK